MWAKILVGAVVLIAAACVAWRLWRTLTGRARCNCAKSSSCPMAPNCKEAKPPKE